MSANSSDVADCWFHIDKNSNNVSENCVSLSQRLLVVGLREVDSQPSDVDILGDLGTLQCSGAQRLGTFTELDHSNLPATLRQRGISNGQRRTSLALLRW